MLKRRAMERCITSVIGLEFSVASCRILTWLCLALITKLPNELSWKQRYDLCILTGILVHVLVYIWLYRTVCGPTHRHTPCLYSYPLPHPGIDARRQVLRLQTNGIVATLHVCTYETVHTAISGHWMMTRRCKQRLQITTNATHNSQQAPPEYSELESNKAEPIHC